MCVCCGGVYNKRLESSQAPAGERSHYEHPSRCKKQRANEPSANEPCNKTRRADSVCYLTTTPTTNMLSAIRRPRDGGLSAVDTRNMQAHRWSEDALAKLDRITG